MIDYYAEARTLHEREKFEEALKLYEQGIAAGDEKCWYGYGIFLKEGHALEQNEEKGIEILKEHYDKIFALANSGDAAAMRIVGFYFANGFNGDGDNAEAFEWIMSAAEQGDIGAMFNLGDMYYDGRGIEQNHAEALRWYTAAAEQGHASAQYDLALMYDEGEGVEQNYTEALRWYTAAAEQGDSDAQWNLGYMYHFGEGAKRNYSEAIKWYTKSAEQGDPDSQWCLGTMYENGEGVERDLERAFDLYYKSAKQDNEVGQYHIGHMYFSGKQVERNIEEAIKWYQKAATNGSHSAQFFLGELFYSGVGVERSVKQAIEWWHKAVEDDEFIDEDAAYRLGYAYYDGIGVEQDLKKAKEYFELAFENGYSCSYAIDMVKYELSREINKKSAQENGDNLMRQYAEKIIKKKNFYVDLPSTVSKDLKKDFGDTWKKLQNDTQKSLVTAIYDYVMHYPSKEYMEFNSTINGICRALEIELGKILYTGYVQYLIDQNIDPNTFSKNRSFIKQISKNEFAYHQAEDTSNFTLGGLKYVVGLEKEKSKEAKIVDSHDNHKQAKSTNVIDKTMIEYMRYICQDDAFGDIDEERAVTDYLVYFTQEIGAIADSLRNPAAHANIMTYKKAEVCGNYIIKVKKILKHFLEKIDFDKFK